MRRDPDYRYSVVRDIWSPWHAEIALVRRRSLHGILARLRHHGRDDAVLFHRTFTHPDLGAIEGYAAELERVADYANAGKLGCFVDVRVTDGALQMTLYERWFDGSHIRCDELTKRSFDPQNGQALIESAEFLGELEYWAERRDERRNLRELEGSIEDAAREDETLNRALAAQELGQILHGHVSRV
jgi:hypothetical protein